MNITFDTILIGLLEQERTADVMGKVVYKILQNFIHQAVTTDMMSVQRPGISSQVEVARKHLEAVYNFLEWGDDSEPPKHFIEGYNKALQWVIKNIHLL